MFYGLNKLVKNLLPKRLFYRALLIVAIPVILIQLIITIVFFDSLWIKTNILVFIQRLSKKTIVIINWIKITGIATINKAL